MKRFSLGALALALLWFGGRAAWRALASHETRIRWQLEEAVEGFNRTRLKPALAPFAEDYRDASGVDRLALQHGLMAIFLGPGGSGGSGSDGPRGFPLRLELEPEPAITVVRPGAESAEAELRLRLFERAGEGEALRWDVRVNAELTRGEAGWRIRASRHETLDGRRPR